MALRVDSTQVLTAADERMHRNGHAASTLAFVTLTIGAYSRLVLGVHGYYGRTSLNMRSSVDSSSTSMLPVDEPRNSFTPGVIL